MNIIGIDYGTKRIGLARWNSEVDVVLPLKTVSNLLELVEVINIEKADKIIMGLPQRLDSQIKSKNMERVKKFADQLKNEIDIAVEFIDERFSSQQADRLGNGVSRDERSAMIILQSYLDKNINK